MKTDERVHKFLEHVFSLPDNVSSVDTDKIDIGWPLAKLNAAAQKLIDNGDAVDCTTKDNAQAGSIGVLITRATRDAYTTKKYMDKP